MTKLIHQMLMYVFILAMPRATMMVVVEGAVLIDKIKNSEWSTEYH